jgi:hypothetical protein
MLQAKASVVPVTSKSVTHCLCEFYISEGQVLCPRTLSADDARTVRRARTRLKLKADVIQQGVKV